MRIVRGLSYLGVVALLTLFLACASTEETVGEVSPESSATSSPMRDAATAAITRAEAFESQEYAPEPLQGAYDFLDQGDAEQSDDLWQLSKDKADEASSIAGPLVGQQWLEQLEEGRQRLDSLRADLYLPEYNDRLLELIEQAHSAAEAQDWDTLLGIYQKTNQPLQQVVTTLDENLSWLNQLKKETEAIISEAIRKEAQEYVPEALTETQNHYQLALDSLDANDLEGLEKHLFMARHFGRETLRVLDLTVNLKDVDGQINRQGLRLTQALRALEQEQKLSDSDLQAWSSEEYLQANPLIEIDLGMRPYPGDDEGRLQQPPVELSALALQIQPIESYYQAPTALIAQEFNDQQSVSTPPPAASVTEEPEAGDGLELLVKARDAWQSAVGARNEGDLEKARYYLGESSRHLNNYTTQYSVLTIYTVKRGDSLWRISAKEEVYADAYKWPYIYLRNRDLISNPNLIYPGQKFIVPVMDYEIPNINEIIQDASELYENSRRQRG